MPEKHQSDKTIPTLEQIARICYEARRDYFLTLDQKIGPIWGKLAAATQDDYKWRVQKIIESPQRTPENLHEEWMDAQKADGWKGGVEYNIMHKVNPDITAYINLSTEKQRADKMLFSMVRELIRFMG